MSDKFGLVAPVEARQEIKKSRFVAYAAPVDSEAAAKAFFAAHADPGANHNCWAWRVGNAYRFNDDGEPSGTAGKPILQAIDGQGFDCIAVLVTRWFGGVLLGSGGLMRAYGGTAALCLRAGEKVPLIAMSLGEVACGFSDLALFQARLGSVAGVELLSPRFTDAGAVLGLRFPASATDTLAGLVNDLSHGRETLRVL